MSDAIIPLMSNMEYSRRLRWVSEMFSLKKILEETIKMDYGEEKSEEIIEAYNAWVLSYATEKYTDINKEFLTKIDQARSSFNYLAHIFRLNFDCFYLLEKIHNEDAPRKIHQSVFLQHQQEYFDKGGVIKNPNIVSEQEVLFDVELLDLLKKIKIILIS